MLHKIILWIFESLINIEKFLRVVCLFFIMFLCLYWIQNLIGASWWWLMFFAPVLEGILNFVNNIYSVSFDFWGKTLEIKYFNALALVLVAIGVLKLIDMGLEYLRDLYDDMHRAYKKTTENIFNESLQSSVNVREKLSLKYAVFIQTKISNRHITNLKNIDIKIENKKMKDLISERLNVQPMESWGGFAYYFDNFEKIDEVLDTLFEIIKASPYIDYAVCVQIGDNIKQIKQLAGLNCWGKIVIAADTLYRYSLNSSRRYKTNSFGIFQKESGTLEVHEFVNNL